MLWLWLLLAGGVCLFGILAVWAHTVPSERYYDPYDPDDPYGLE